MSEPEQNPQAEAIQELVGMTANLDAIKTLIEVVHGATIQGSTVQKVAQGLFFLQGMKAGTEARIKELEEKMPKPSPVVISPTIEVSQGSPIEVGASR